MHVRRLCTTTARISTYLLDENTPIVRARRTLGFGGRETQSAAWRRTLGCEDSISSCLALAADMPRQDASIQGTTTGKTMPKTTSRVVEERTQQKYIGKASEACYYHYIRARPARASVHFHLSSQYHIIPKESVCPNLQPQPGLSSASPSKSEQNSLQMQHD